MYLGVLRPTEPVFVVYLGVPRHVDVQEKILTEIMVCISGLNVPEGFRPTEYVSVDYFDVPRHVDAEETILS